VTETVSVEEAIVIGLPLGDTVVAAHLPITGEVTEQNPVMTVAEMIATTIMTLEVAAVETIVTMTVVAYLAETAVPPETYILVVREVVVDLAVRQSTGTKVAVPLLAGKIIVEEGAEKVQVRLMMSIEEEDELAATRENTVREEVERGAARENIVEMPVDTSENFLSFILHNFYILI